MPRRKILKPQHDDPGRFWQDYILLPYGEFYDKTKLFLGAKKGDTLRFFNGNDFRIESASKVHGERMCDVLCKIRYGIPWELALSKWTEYARMEGFGKDVFSRDTCIILVFNRKNGADSL